jgi:hypothetical protein
MELLVVALQEAVLAEQACHSASGAKVTCTEEASVAACTAPIRPLASAAHALGRAPGGPAAAARSPA